MRLYFVRHGESEANIRKEFSNQNYASHPLTEKGQAQAQALQAKLRDVKFTAVYASPLLRARQTAAIINAPHGLEIQITPALREHDAGELEGRADPASWQQYSQLFEMWTVKRDLDARIPGGESFNEMRSRFAPFFQDLVSQYGATDANILLVGHGGIFHSMLPLLLTNVGYAFGYKHILGNTAVVLAEYQQDGLVCVEWDGVRLTPTGGVVE